MSLLPFLPTSLHFLILLILNTKWPWIKEHKLILKTGRTELGKQCWYLALLFLPLYKSPLITPLIKTQRYTISSKQCLVYSSDITLRSPQIISKSYNRYKCSPRLGLKELFIHSIYCMCYARNLVQVQILLFHPQCLKPRAAVRSSLKTCISEKRKIFHTN